MSNQSSLIYISHTNRPEDGAKLVAFGEKMKNHAKIVVNNDHRITYVIRHIKKHYILHLPWPQHATLRRKHRK